MNSNLIATAVLGTVRIKHVNSFNGRCNRRSAVKFEVLGGEVEVVLAAEVEVVLEVAVEAAEAVAVASQPAVSEVCVKYQSVTIR